MPYQLTKKDCTNRFHQKFLKLIKKENSSNANMLFVLARRTTIKLTEKGYLNFV